MTPLFASTPGDPSTQCALYVILSGVLCTGVGWVGRTLYARLRKESIMESRAPLLPETAGQGGNGERSREMETELAGVVANRDALLRELDDLRPRAARADEALERARQLEEEHRKAVEALAAAELALRATPSASFEAGPPSNGERERWLAAEKLLEETRSLEAAASRELATLRARLTKLEARPAVVSPEEQELEAARRVAAEAREESLTAAAIGDQLRRELAEAQAALEETRASTTAGERRILELKADLEDARNRAVALESVMVSPGGESVALPNLSLEELAQARTVADAVREELKAANEEILRLRGELAARRSRPIWTSPRPEN